MPLSVLMKFFSRPAIGALGNWLGSALVLLAVGGLPSFASGQTPSLPELKLIASDHADGDSFGAHSTISGDTLVVGAYRDDSSAGSVYVFVRNGGVWTLQAKLTASVRSPGAIFGRNVALSGDTLVVASRGEDSAAGAAYVFVRSGSTWTEQARLTANDRAANANFGSPVVISGNTAIIGSSFGDALAGSAYVFVRDGTSWTQQSKLVPSDSTARDLFGISASLDGDTAIIGAHGTDTSTGSAYVFTRSGNSWSEQAKLNSSDRAGRDFFGFNVAISGDTAVVGALGNNAGKGAAYVFVRTGATWVEQQKLTASDAAFDDNFAHDVAISGDRILVGAYGDDAAAGSAYLFVRGGGTWTQQIKLTASDRADGDRYGSGVLIDGDTFLVGAPFDDLSAGAVYLYNAAQYTVTPTAVPAGSITPFTPQTVLFGGQVSFTITPQPGLTAVVTGTCGGTLAGNVFTTLPVTNDCTVNVAFSNAPVLTALQSRKLHAGAGPFDLAVTLNVPISGAVTVEPRAIGSGHTLVFQFNNPVTSVGAVTVVDALSAAVGAATVTPSGNDAIVTLTNIADNTRVTVTLNGINGAGTATASMGFLVGDINNSRSVNSSDISGVKARSGQTATVANFLFDVNASGSVNSSDISAVKARSGLVLP
ncbi:MAG: dockerin type I domain-containing protein [Usitatibacteraceae bacterium]